MDTSKIYWINSKGEQIPLPTMNVVYLKNAINSLIKAGNETDWRMPYLKYELSVRNAQIHTEEPAKELTFIEQAVETLKNLREQRKQNEDNISSTYDIITILEDENDIITTRIDVLEKMITEFVITEKEVIEVQKEDVSVKKEDNPVTLEEIFFPEDDDPNLPARHSEDFKTVPPPPYDYWERYLLLSKEIIKTKQLINKVKWAFDDNYIFNMAQALMVTKSELMSMKNYGKKAHANFVDYCERKGYKIGELAPYRQKITERLSTEADLEEKYK